MAVELTVNVHPATMLPPLTPQVRVAGAPYSVVEVADAGTVVGENETELSPEAQPVPVTVTVVPV